MIRVNIKGASPEYQKVIDKATQMLEQATGDVRKISHNMMPGLLTKMGFYEAVEDLFENLNDIEDMEATCEITGEQNRLPENKEIMLYRITQEMVNNTLKHAGAKHVDIKIKIFPEKLMLKYKDDGVGFDKEKVLQSETESLGLKSIQSRINFLNGEVSIHTKPGEGVEYSIGIPT